MNLREANLLASCIDAFDRGVSTTLPTNIEIRDFVRFLSSVVPKEEFDSSLTSTVQREPFRFDASVAARIRLQFALATKAIERDQKLKDRVLRECVSSAPEKPFVSESLAVIFLFFGAIFSFLVWRNANRVFQATAISLPDIIQLLLFVIVAAGCFTVILPSRIARHSLIALSIAVNGLVVFIFLWKLGGYWQWLAAAVAVSISLLMIATVRKRSKGNHPGRDRNSVEFSNFSTCETGFSGDCGGSGGD